VDDETRVYLDDLRREMADFRRHVDAGLTEVRRHSGVLVESLRGEIQTVAEGVVLNRAAIDRLTEEMHARFAAAEAVNQAAFADVHREIAEVRRDVADLQSRL
jgi:ubiquinone biosynthesis protein UbiJ